MKIIEKKEQQLHGYTGKILRLNLTDSTTEIVSTYKYVPRYIGGRTVADRIFWEEVGPEVGAYDPENKLIFMTGATCGSGMPASGRNSLCGISPNSFPEQYSHSNMGGYFGGMLKYAGYDGLIIEGKAPKHTYVYIQDDKVQFLDADGFIWGEYMHEAQEKIFERHGKDAQSIVIGPAGENLHRNASVTNNNDSTSSKAGFGAVFGSKNLKAIAVKGTGFVQAANPEEVINMHKTVGYPSFDPNPLTKKTAIGVGQNVQKTDPWSNARICTCYGCNIACLNTMFDAKDTLHEGKTTAATMKCLDGMAFNFTYDCPRGDYNNVHSRGQEKPRNDVYDKLRANPDHNGAFSGSYQYNKFRVNDEQDPGLKTISYFYPGQKMNYYGPNFERQQIVSVLCNQLGLDKWDTVVWYLTWLSAAKQEGLLEDLDFGMEVDVDNPEFVKHFILMMTYRKGELGDLFAEGMARAIRKLGKEKYGDTLYHNALGLDGEPIEIPVSLEAVWGHCSHYHGRGFQGCKKESWLVYALICMADTRDAVPSGHFHDWADECEQYRDDPCHSELFANCVVRDEIRSHLKDSLVTCEWRSPNMGWPDMEARMFNAVTGLDVNMDDLYDASMAGFLLARAILMRNHGRCRDMEVEAMYPYLTYPDICRERVTWDEWNDLVDLYYKAHGFDIATGWPFRSTWEKYHLGDIADEMERLGMLPPEEGTTGYVRKANPFTR